MSNSAQYKCTQPLAEFADEFLVKCPRCSHLCKVTINSPEISPGDRLFLFYPRKATCFGCGFLKEWAGDSIDYPDGCDWYFCFPLWLQVPCRGNVLWAFNEQHLEVLENYIKGKQRAQPQHRSLISKLPAWIKSSKNRPEILKCIGVLRKRLDA